jgi:hypothetical protein
MVHSVVCALSNQVRDSAMNRLCLSCYVVLTMSADAVSSTSLLWSATACRRFLTALLTRQCAVTKRRQAVALQSEVRFRYFPAGKIS